MKDINETYVSKFVKSWESRHDEWVRNYLAPLLKSDKLTMHEIRPVLKYHLETDWRYSLAFFIDRTTYQSRKDIVNIRTATYLFKKIISLPSIFSQKAISGLIQNINYEKENNIVTHIRVKTDIRRLEYICKFLINSNEKNFTILVLQKIRSKRDIWKLLDQFPYVSRNKTAPFYIKFISWLFDLNLKPITVDRHVLNSLQRRNIISSQNPNEAISAIVKLSDDLNLPVVKIETALYEESWLKTNNPTM